jgi:hypothetical protein
MHRHSALSCSVTGLENTAIAGERDWQLECTRSGKANAYDGEPHWNVRTSARSGANAG